MGHLIATAVANNLEKRQTQMQTDFTIARKTIIRKKQIDGGKKHQQNRSGPTPYDITTPEGAAGKARYDMALIAYVL